MTRSKLLTIAAATVALGVFAALPNTASAQWGGNPQWGGGYGWNSYNSGWNQRYQPRRWHDTSHWDYHPTTVVPHGDHLHVVPGHYDWHQTGHMHGGRRNRQHNHHHH